MKNFRILFTFLVVFSIAGTVSAQNKREVSKAETKTAELDESLRSIDASLALTDDQRQMVYDAYLEGLVSMNEARKSADDKEAGKEAVKPLRKVMNKKIRKEILRKDQRRALNNLNKEK